MRKLVTNEAGNVAAIAAITVFGVAIGAGFAMNMNRMETTADYLQRVADSAAIGAVVAGQDRTRSDAEVKVAGNALAAAMLTARHGSAKVNTAVEDREPTRVTVQITEDIDMIFGGLMSRTTQTLTRTATAENQAAVPVCLLVLNPTAPGAVKLQGSPQIRTQSCSVHVNSAAEGAVTVGGAAGIEATSISIAGPPSRDGKIEPKPAYNQPIMEDPFADEVTWPGLGACDEVGYTARKNDADPPAGRYCGGMTFANGANVELKGVYIIQTGSLSFSANAKVRAPDGVTIILLDPVGALSMQGSADVNLQASTSGDWAGIVLAIKPQPTRRTSTLQGGNNLTLGGVVYMPTQTLRMQGGNDLGGMPVARGFVVDSFEMQGSGELKLAGDPSLMGKQSNPRLIR